MTSSEHQKHDPQTKAFKNPRRGRVRVQRRLRNFSDEGRTVKHRLHHHDKRRQKFPSWSFSLVWRRRRRNESGGSRKRWRGREEEKETQTRGKKEVEHMMMMKKGRREENREGGMRVRQEKEVRVRKKSKMTNKESGWFRTLNTINKKMKQEKKKNRDKIRLRRGL